MADVEPRVPPSSAESPLQVTESTDSAPLLESGVEAIPPTTSSSSEATATTTFSQRVASLFSKPWRSAAAAAVPPSSSSEASSSTSSVPPPQQQQQQPGTVPIVTESESGGFDIESGGGEIQISPNTDSTPNSSSAPVCLICLETFAADDFASGRAISLGCKCRGELSLRHLQCAQKWAQVKDNGSGGVPICELCKEPTKMPPLPPRPHLLRPPAAAVGANGGVATVEEELAYANFAPSTADLVFDCIRVTWVAMIISILFFEASLGSALWTGAVAGFAYSVMVRIMYRQHFEAMRAYAEQQQQQQGGAAVIGVPPPPPPPPPAAAAAVDPHTRLLTISVV